MKNSPKFNFPFFWFLCKRNQQHLSNGKEIFLNPNEGVGPTAVGLNVFPSSQIEAFKPSPASLYHHLLLILT